MGAGTFGGGEGEGICGCTDPTACNFSLTAIYDDESCEYFDCDLRESIVVEIVSADADADGIYLRMWMC